MGNVSEPQLPAHLNKPGPIAVSVRSELGLKLLLSIVLPLWVYLPYQLLQRFQFFPAMEMPLGWLDRLIPFQPQAVWLYLSIYLLMPIPAFLMIERRHILHYAAGIALFSLLADFVFLFWPTTCPRPMVTDANAVYRGLTLIDNPFNAFPSLHAAFAVYSALCGEWVKHQRRRPWLWRTTLWAWALLILFSTLATKQHVLTDIVAGSALGLASFVCVFNPIATNSASNLVARFSGKQSRPLCVQP